jgi:hypothetical protein
MKVKKYYLFIMAPVAAVIFLWLSGLIGLWTGGMACIANNTKEFTDRNGHVVQGEYTIAIDLSNLESNIGKELYNDGTHRIYVSWVDNTGNINSGGYSIGFRSSGHYSLTGASLISGGHHATVNGNSFTTNMTAKMTAQYNSKNYTSSVSVVSELNYKDGDDFAFYIFPTESYEMQEISLNETGIVHLTVTELFKNIWSKK